MDPESVRLKIIVSDSALNTRMKTITSGLDSIALLGWTLVIIKSPVSNEGWTLVIYLSLVSKSESETIF